MTSEMIEKEIGDELRRMRLSIATAESCTGGLISHRITNVSGSSDYYKGSVIAYANEVKEKILGVAGQTLREKGAVSAECAVEMAKGVNSLLGSDVGIAATGIAGPTGGTPDKPVGLVYIALATNDYVYHEKHIFHRDREGNKYEAANAALEVLKRYLLRRARSSER
ncbi:MAG: CinA family protein [Methanophagales archaeon]|nr:CinA family protein [Methanophagales archaeon]